MKKGFTLIELLAVIVILGIILTFAIMSVSGFIEKSEQQALIKEADSILDVVRYQISSGEELSKEYNITNGKFVETNKFSYDGGLPENGKILVRNTDELSIAISDGYWCVSKSYLDKNYKVYKDEGSCNPTLDITTDSEMAKCFTFTDNIPGYGENVGLSISKYTCSSKDIIIPNSYNGKLIVGIKPMNCTNCIRKVDMSYADSLIVIGYNAFYNAGLEEVIFSSNLNTISDRAFSQNKLKTIDMPATVKVLGDYAFVSNELTDISLPTSITDIGEGAFNNNLLSDEDAFIATANNPTRLVSYGGINRTSVTIPASFTNIGRYALNGLNLKNIIIPNSVTTIEDGAFSSSMLESVTIPNSVTNIGRNAFAYNQLSNVTIPNSVTIIDNGAFYSNKLTNVVIPNSVTHMGNSAFANNNLSTVVIPNSITDIGVFAFYKDSSSNRMLNSINYNGTTPYDWNSIINNYSGTPFTTGVVTNPYGNVTISAN